MSTGPEVGRLSRLQDLPEVGSGPLVVCSMPFALPLPSFLLCFPALPFKYALISRFKGVLAGFGVRMHVCMG